jgi:chromosome segregation ATPase
MAWIAWALLALGMTAAALWLNTQFNAREQALQAKEQQLGRTQIQQQAGLDDRFKKAQAYDQALQQRQMTLNDHAQWLREQEARLQKIHETMEAKVKAAYAERDSARKRAKRLQEEIKQLKGKKANECRVAT